MKSYYSLSILTLIGLEAQNRDLPFDSLSDTEYEIPGVKAVNFDDNNSMQPSNRNSNPMLFAKFAEICNYGCFCHFGGNFHMGKGEPLDLYDSECRGLVKGYECIIMDHNYVASCVP